MANMHLESAAPWICFASFAVILHILFELLAYSQGEMPNNKSVTILCNVLLAL